MRNLNQISKNEISKRREFIRQEREANQKLQIETYAKVNGVSESRAKLVMMGLVKPR
jgi:hypothetical protein